MKKLYFKRLLSFTLAILMLFPMLLSASSSDGPTIKYVYFRDESGNMVFVDYEHAIEESLGGDHTLYNAIKHYVGIAESKGRLVYLETDTDKILDYRLAMIDNLFRLQEIIGKAKYEVNGEIEYTHELKLVDGVARIVKVEDPPEDPVNIVKIYPVDDITVAYGTSELEAIRQLDRTTTIKDSDDDIHTVDLSWRIFGYDGEAPGEYQAIGRFTLPEGISNEYGLDLRVEAKVTVLDDVPVPIEWPKEVESVFVGTSDITNNTYANIRIKSDYISAVEAVHVDDELANNIEGEPSQWRIQVGDGTTVDDLRGRIRVTTREESQTFVETFDNLDNTGGSYVAGSFVGVNGITWEYSGARGDLAGYEIDGKGLMFRRPSDDPFINANIQGGIKDFSVDLKKAYTGSGRREMEVLVNDQSRGTFVLDNNIEGVQKFIVNDINIEGEFKLEIRHIGASSGAQVTIDNITWTSYGGGGEDTQAPIIVHTPVTKANTSSDLEIRATVTDNTGVENVDLYYRTTGESQYKSIVMTLSNGTYLGIIPKEELSTDGLQYYIEATDGNNVSTSPEDINIPYNVKITDGDLPPPVPGEYNFYFGQLHSHTNLSDGSGSPDDAYTWARDRGQADFFAVTDHSNSFDNDRDNEDITDVSQSTSTKWKTLNAKADQYNSDGEYVAIAGYEMTWSGSTGGWGHMNTFNTPWFASRNNSKMNLQAYYNKIAQWPESINQFNHPGKTFGDFADFGFYSLEADNVIQLIEVGNGEGPIRGSGYFPSYEYYTRALDKGWHIAPTNNQDNHKGNWITSNEARTVVIAEDRTRDSIYDAIRDLRVYSTENRNLEIMYKINGEIMGSQLDEPELLSFSIDVNDPDVNKANEKISRIEIISNGGVVVASQNFDSHDVEWNFDLPPQYDYYYVRVIQANKDISVTAPIWTAEVDTVSLDLDISSDYFELGDSTDLTATLANNNEEMITRAKLEFYAGTISPENKIGEETVTNITQGSNAKATISWTPQITGEFNIYVVATIEGMDEVLTDSGKLEVVPVGSAVKVMVDYAHNNHYVSGGDYADKIEGLKAIIKEKNMIMVENHDEITDTALEGIDILIITSTQPIDRGQVPRSKLSDDEIQAVKRFTDRGGSLILTSRANYSDGTGEYQNSVKENKILTAIGSNIIFNSDQVVDEVNNGGQHYRLYFDTYTSTKYNLTEGLTSIDEYSFYSGCSVLLKDGGNDEKVDFLVKGHSTTKNDNAGGVATGHIPLEEGNVYVIAGEILPSGGKVIASGNTFFSDFEVSGDNRYSNGKLASNVLDWLRPENEVEVKTIREVRDGMPENFGETFTIEGRVTSQSVACGAENAFFDVIYVQDETAGITVFGVSQRELPLGTKVRITGESGQYEGDYQLRISNEFVDLIILENEVVELEPLEMSTGHSMLKTNEGWLVKVEGLVTGMNDSGSLFIDDGSGEARIYVNGYIGDGSGDEDKLGKWDPSIEVGDTVSAIGLASTDPEGPRLRVRNTAEIIKIGSP